MAEFVRGGPSVSNSAKVRTRIIHRGLFIRYRIVVENALDENKSVVIVRFENF